MKRKISFGGVVLLLCMLIVFNQASFVKAGYSSWSQTDWDGGVTTQTAKHPDNQTNWKKYSSATNVSADDDLTLSQESEAHANVYTSDTDFDPGTFNSSEVTGLGSAASLTLDSVAGVSVPPLSAGEDHACAVKSDGSLFCWGNNDSGQLGLNSTSTAYYPAQVHGLDDTGYLTDIIQSAAGSDHTCALKSDGTVYCWGYNWYGQLGDGTQTTRYMPVQVHGEDNNGYLTDVVEVSAGEQHSCALKSDGTVYCWGMLWPGQSGSSGENNYFFTPESVLAPSGVENLSGIEQISSGYNHACGISNSHEIYCWGNNSYGQLGDGTTTASGLRMSIKVKSSDGLSDFSSAKNVEGGYAHTCTVTTDGAAYCWGSNSNGQLGDNSTTNRDLPVRVHGENDQGNLADVESISAGNQQSCAINGDGAAYCWGEGWDGELGDGLDSYSYTPVQVLNVAGTDDFQDAYQVSAGKYFTCATDIDGAVYCWGSNNTGAIGNNGSGNIVPAAVINPEQEDFDQLTAVASSQIGTCTLKTDGTVYCWGYNGAGTVGDGTTTNRTNPVQVHGVGDVGYLSGVSKITRGSDMTCALKTDGTVYCWGSGYAGDLGTGDGAGSYVPIQVHGVGNFGYLTDITDISAGAYHVCGLKSDQTVYCWGSNSFGQVGNNTISNQLSPVQVHGVSDVGFLTEITQISTGDSHTCALKSDGSMYCWGMGSYGRLGFNSTSNSYTPVQVHGVNDVGFLSNIIKIKMGNSNSCAIDNSNNIYCWGYNSVGQLGDNTTTSRYTPVQVHGVNDVGYLTGVIDMMRGSNFGCALKSDSSLYCWGLGDYGRLGSGSLSTSYTPVQVHGLNDSGYLTGISSLSNSTNGSHACVVRTDNTLNCWGYNQYGQVATGTSSDYFTYPQLGILINYQQLNLGVLASETSYNASGDYISAAIDLGQTALINSVQFHSDLPTGTAVKVQLAVNNDNTSWDFVGPDGTAATYFTSTEESAGPSLQNNRYVKYKVYLSTTDTSVTPELTDLTLNYAFGYYNSPGELISSAYDTKDPQNSLVSVRWTEELAEGTDVKIQVRTSADGNTWTEWMGPDGTASSYFTNPDGSETIPSDLADETDDEWIQYKVILESGEEQVPETLGQDSLDVLITTADEEQPRVTPSVRDITLEYNSAITTAPPEPEECGYLRLIKSQKDKLTFDACIEKDKKESENIDDPKGTSLKKLEIKAKEKIDGEIEVRRLSHKPHGFNIPKEETLLAYKYLRLNPDFSSDRIDEVDFTLEVAKSWQSDNRINQMVFFHGNGNRTQEMVAGKSIEGDKHIRYVFEKQDYYKWLALMGEKQRDKKDPPPDEVVPPDDVVPPVVPPEIVTPPEIEDPPIVPDTPVPPTGEIDEPKEETISPWIEPTATVISSGAVTISLLSVLPQVKTMSRFMFMGNTGMLNLFGINTYKRRKRKYGIVYDTATGDPIQWAIVKLIGDDGKVRDTKFTDEFGSYFFLVKEGNYHIEVLKDGYKFATDQKTFNTLYENTYLPNEVITAKEGQIVNRNVPMVLEKEGTSAKVLAKSRILKFIDYLFWVGLAFSLVALFLTPVLYNLVVVIVYIVLIVLRAAKGKIAYGLVLTLENIARPFYFVKAYDAMTGQMVARTLSDDKGRYLLVLNKGDYLLRASNQDNALEKRVSLTSRSCVDAKIVG